MTRRLLSALAVIVLTAACAPTPEEAPADPATLAETLAREMLIVDTHVDVPYRLLEKMEDIAEATPGGHFDYPRAKAGGLDAPFMSIYVPARFQEGGAKEHADELIDMVEKIAADAPGKFAVATSPAEVREIAAAGKIALPLGMENGAPIEGDLDNLRHFYERGIRYITLTHSENNHICDSSYAEEKTWDGLSEFGRELVAEMNRLGVMIDVSHVSDDAFRQVMELSEAPVIASHSSCRRFTPDWERNMDDEMIRALAENGGVIAINFGSAFLRDDARKQSSRFWEIYRAFLAENDVAPGSDEAQAFRDEHWSQNQLIRGTVEDVADHIDHVVELVGIDHVGFGSDYDGVFSVPEGLDDVSYFPNLIRVLLERGYSEEEIEKIAHGNVMRVWEEVERIAAASGEAS